MPPLECDAYDHRGRFLGCSEIAFPEYKTAFEDEGDHHGVDRRQRNRDIEKYQNCVDAGWQVIRVTAHLLYRTPGVLLRQENEAFR